MNHEQYKEKLAKDSAYQAVRKRNKHKLPLVISAMLIKARQTKKMTQQELADELGTRQSSIARLENGLSLPSLLFLKRIADIYKTDLIPPRFSFLKQADTATHWIVAQEEDGSQETLNTASLFNLNYGLKPVPQEENYHTVGNTAGTSTIYALV